MTAGMVKSSAATSKVPDNLYLDRMVASAPGWAMHGENITSPKNPHMDQNLAVHPLHYNQKRNMEDSNTYLPKGLISSSRCNLHAVADHRTMDLAVPKSSNTSKIVGRGPDDGSHSLSAWVDAVLKTGNSCLTHPSLQNFRTIDQSLDGAVADKESASSNVELRLGQPYQQSQYLSNAALPITKPKPSVIPADHPKSCYRMPINHSASNHGARVESRRGFHSASVLCDSTPREEQSRMIIENRALNEKNTRDASKLREVKVGSARGSMFAPLLHLQPERGLCSNNNSSIAGVGEYVMPKTLYSKSHLFKSGPINFPWSGGSTSERQFNIPELGLLRTIDGSKDTGNSYDCSCVAPEPAFKIQKLVERHGISAGAGIGSSSPNFPAAPVKNHFSYQSPNVTPDTHSATNHLNHPVNSSFIGGTGHADHVFIRSMGLSGGSDQISQSFPFYNLIPMQELAPTISEQEVVNLGPHMLDDNMRLLALKQIQELSWQHTISSGIIQELGRCCCSSSPTIQHGILDPSTSREQRHGPGPNIPGFNYGCNCSTMAKGFPLCSRGIDTQCQFFNDPSSNMQPSLRGKRESIMQSSQPVNCCQKVPSSCFLRNCTCAAQAKCKGYSESRIGNSPVTSKDELCFCHEASSLASASEFLRNHINSRDRDVPLDERLQLNGELSKSQCYHNSKWRDVPGKRKEACDSIWLGKDGHDKACKVPSADVLDNSRNTKCKQGDAAAERSIGFGKILDSSKGKEKSNVSSECSGPAVTQASFEVNNVNSSTVGAGDTRISNNLVDDEGSAIDEYWSSDVAIESERSADSPGASCKSITKKEVTSRVPNVLSPRSLIDELKLMNSLSWKKGQSYSPTGLTTCGKSDNQKGIGISLKAGKRRKFMKLQMIDRFFSNGSQDNGLDEVSDRKRLKRARASDSANNHKTQPVYKNAEILSNVKPVCNEKADSSFDVAYTRRNATPFVCGIYGEIYGGQSIGDERKPVKYASLSRILKNTRRIDPKTSKAKLTSLRVSKKRKMADSIEGFGVSSNLRQEEKCGSNHPSVLNEMVADELKKACIGGCKPSDTVSSMWERGSTAYAWPKRCKVIQMRSLYELSVKGKQSNSPINKISRCIPKTKLRNSLKKAGNIICHLCGYIGLLQGEVEGVDNENVGFYGRCTFHSICPKCGSGGDLSDAEKYCPGERESTCARTEGFKGRKQDGFWHNIHDQSKSSRCFVPQEQLNAWAYINGQKPFIQGLPKRTTPDIEYDFRKEYVRYKQVKGRKHLVVYKSGIHALGLYTSRFISRSEMVVEYVGEIVSSRVADKREKEYLSGRKVQYKSACYFFRIDKEHIIDATRKGGIARFVNHSCQPNCVAKVISVRNDKKVVFFAERDIYPGEEITYDYHFNNEDEGKKIPCFCNSKNCRRYLN